MSHINFSILSKRHRSKTSKNKTHKPKYSDSESDSDYDSDDYNDAGGYDSDSVYIIDNRIYFRASVSGNSIDKLIKIINEENYKLKVLRDDIFIKEIVPNPLYLHITSYGGSLMACYRAVDCIKRSIIPIYTVVDGHAASAATLMAVVGRKRYMTPNSYVLIHQLSSGSGGKYWEIKDEYKNCKMMMKDIYNIYEEHTTMTKEELKKYLSHDCWWKAKKCIETGLVDEIYDNDEEPPTKRPRYHEDINE